MRRMSSVLDAMETEASHADWEKNAISAELVELASDRVEPCGHDE